MEKDILKNEAQKMISGSSSGSDSSTARKERGDDVAFSDSSSTDQSDGAGSDSSRLELYSSLTPQKRKTETTSAETSSKKRDGSSSGKKYTIEVDDGKDVVDKIYDISMSCTDRVNMVSATGYISDILFRDQDGSEAKRSGVFEITTLSLLYALGKDRRPSREETACSVSLTDENRESFQSTGVTSLIAKGPIQINLQLENVKSSRESSAAAAGDGSPDSEKATNSPAADGSINPTTGAANDEDKKSLSEEDI